MSLFVSDTVNKSKNSLQYSNTSVLQPTGKYALAFFRCCDVLKHICLFQAKQTLFKCHLNNNQKSSLHLSAQIEAGLSHWLLKLSEQYSMHFIDATPFSSTQSPSRPCSLLKLISHADQFNQQGLISSKKALNKAPLAPHHLCGSESCLNFNYSSEGSSAGDTGALIPTGPADAPSMGTSVNCDYRTLMEDGAKVGAAVPRPPKSLL